MADIIKERAQDLALLECIDTGEAKLPIAACEACHALAGKPVTLAASMDIIRTEENFRTFSHLAQVCLPPPPPPPRSARSGRMSWDVAQEVVL